MKIRPLEKTDDTGAVAALIYETDAFLFPFLFGTREKALPALKALIELDNNSFSHRHIYCAVDDTISGILIAFGYGDVDKKLEENDYRKVFSFSRLIVLGIKSFMLKALYTRQKKDEFYIQNISVVPKVQGRGIGSLLVDFSFQLAAETGCSCLTLDVSGDNPGARRLYERKGFFPQKSFFAFLKGAGVCFMRAPVRG